MKTLMISLALTTLFSFGAFAANPGNQMLTKECVYDFAVHGGAVGQIPVCGNQSIPSGAVVMDMYYMVETAFTSGGSATVALGDVASGARYLAATAFNNAAFTAAVPAKAAIGVPFKLDSANKGKLAITVATAALTAGKMKMWVVFYVPKS